jgi:hypothetical protein
MKSHNPRTLCTALHALVVGRYTERGGSDRSRLRPQHILTQRDTIASHSDFRVRPTTLWTYRDHPVTDSQRSPTRLGNCGTLKNLQCPDRCQDFGEKRSTTLLSCALGNPLQAEQLFVNIRRLPPDDGMIGIEQLQSIDAQLGDLLDEPIKPLALRHRRCDGEWRTGKQIDFDVAGRLDAHCLAFAHNGGQSPAPCSVADTNHHAIAQAQDSAEVVLGIVGQCNNTIGSQLLSPDEDVSCCSSPIVGTRHENADLMRENRPSLPFPTTSSRPLAYEVSASTSSSLSLVGMSTRTRAMRSPRPRPCR